MPEKDRISRSDFFSYMFCGFAAQKIKWSQTQVFLKGHIVYYTTKVLVRNILWKITYFCLFFGKFHALKFWEKQFGKKIWFFWLIKKKILGSVSGVQPNNFFGLITKSEEEDHNHLNLKIISYLAAWLLDHSLFSKLTQASKRSCLLCKATILNVIFVTVNVALYLLQRKNDCNHLYHDI